MIKKIILFLLFLIIYVFPVYGLDFDIKCGYANTEFNSCCVQPTIQQNNNSLIEKIGQEIIENAKDGAQTVITNSPLGYFIGKKCVIGEPVEENDQCICKQLVEPTPVTNYQGICERIFKDKPNFLNSCQTCIRAGGYYSAIGCVPINLSNFISQFLLGRLIGLAGFIALLCIIYSAFQMQSSQGNTEKIKKAQDMLISCLLGLVLIIFSVFILRLIGVNILQIPGLR